MSTIHYLTNSEGSPVAVQIPIAEWELFQQEFEAAKWKIEILQGIKDALGEVEAFRKEEKSLQTLSEFLHEN